MARPGRPEQQPDHSASLGDSITLSTRIKAFGTHICHGNSHQSAVHPPSTTRDDPVISDDASPARNTIAPIKSSTVPSRPSLIFASTLSLNAAFSKKDFVIGVSIKVGHSVLTRTPCGAKSIAIAFENPSIAHFEAQ